MLYWIFLKSRIDIIITVVCSTQLVMADFEVIFSEAGRIWVFSSDFLNYRINGFCNNRSALVKFHCTSLFPVFSLSHSSVFIVRTVAAECLNHVFL